MLDVADAGAQAKANEIREYLKQKYPASTHQAANVYGITDFKQLVQHVREANHMLPSPGKGVGTAGVAKPIEGAIPRAPGSTDLFPTDAAMPLDFELDLEESP